jgi:hypothetical protein
MTALEKRNAIYLDPAILRTLKLKAVETSESISALISRAVRNLIFEESYTDNNISLGGKSGWILKTR